MVFFSFKWCVLIILIGIYLGGMVHIKLKINA